MFLSDPRESDITFGEPGGNAPFSSNREFYDAMSKINGPDVVEIDKQIEKFGTGVRAAERQAMLVDTINARGEALAEAAEHRIRTARDLTGAVIENPYRDGYAREAAARAKQTDTPTEFQDADRINAAARQIFDEKMEALSRDFPDKAKGLDFGQSLEDQARAIGASAGYSGEHHEGGFIASIAGGMWGSRRDPLFLGSLLIGPGVSMASSVIARIGFGALKQGLFNAGLQAAAQPVVQDWRREIGEKSGIVPALENVGMAFIAGAIPGAGIEVGRAIHASTKAALSRVAAGEARAGDVDAVARGIGIKLDDETTRAMKVGEADHAADAAAIGEPPAGVAAQDHTDMVAQAVRHVEDPANNPPPEIPLSLPPRPAGQARVLEEALPAAIGDRDVVDGKPVTFGRFDPAELSTDAAAFQYKGGGDAAGVTDRLKHVTRWDPLASGKTLIFERADGTRVVADGHQRLGLAKRLGAAPSPASDAVRFYHGHSDAMDPASGGPRWLTPQENYAQGYGSKVSYVDIPRRDLETNAALASGFDDINGFARNFEAPDAVARQLRPLRNESVKLDGFVFREADGWTPQDVRAMAAKKNMQEGSGDAIDAARVLRDRPDLLDGSMPVSSPMMKAAISLTRLSDEAFGMTINGVVPPSYAAAVGAMVPDRLQHASVISDLVKFAPETEREARLLIGEVMAVGFRAEEQINLFGAAPAVQSLMGERVKVLDAALVGLSRDKKLFGTLAAKADAIEAAAGNQLARDTNDARAQDAAQLRDMLTRLARRTGPVSDALNRAAAQMADGVKSAKAADAFLEDVRALLDRDGLAGLLADPELKPRVTVEPASPEAATAAETAYAERTGPNQGLFGATALPLPAAPKTAVRSPQEVREALRAFIDGQRGVTVDELYARAHILQADLNAAGMDLIAAHGVRFVDPGPKALEALAKKIERKGYTGAHQITDAARGGFVVDNPRQADALAAALAKRFDAIDEGWAVSDVGYTDRKILVRGADGTVGEIQIIPASMYEAKKNGGQALYTARRSMAAGAEKDAAIARERDLYSAAADKLGSDWAGIFERSSGPNSGSNAARHLASGQTAAELETSSASTATQGAPGSSTANAERPGSSTAGRQSQLQNLRGINGNISDAAQQFKIAVEGMKAAAGDLAGVRSAETKLSDARAQLRSAAGVLSADDINAMPQGPAREAASRRRALFGELENIIERDMPLAQEGRVSGWDAAGVTPDDPAVLEARAADIMRQLETGPARSLIESVAVSARPDGRDARFVSPREALDAADRIGEHADIVQFCEK